MKRFLRFAALYLAIAVGELVLLYLAGLLPQSLILEHMQKIRRTV